ncbi:hypothetical protein ACQ7HM_16870 [Williamsia sp. MIQD14]|uniref:hypothetical protein n=1 Tax=Williamsia sp. MIQD14 TaxID=3425703 RepID=UPI003DA07487
MPDALITRPHVRRAQAVGACAVIAAVVAACGSADPGPGGASSSSAAAGCTTDSTVGASGASLLPVPPAAVEVLDSGAAPLIAPVGSPTTTSAQQVRLVTTSSSTSLSQGQAPSDDAQTVDLPITAQVLCGDPTDIELTLGAASSPSPDLSASLAAVRGSRAGLAVAAGSVPIALRIVPAAGADDAARSAIEQTLVQALQRSVTLPRDPIGVGARWRSVRTITGAATLRQTITSTLRARTGSTLQIDVTVDEEPVNAVFTIPGSDQTLTIASYSMAGAGSMTLDLSRGLPMSGELSIDGGRSLVGSDAARPLVQKTGVDIRWETTR